MKSPVVHIVFAGVLLGLVPVVLLGRPSAVEDDRRVVITASDVEQLRAGWVKLWQRVRDEVLYREAVRRGYDQGHRLVCHTMKLTMEFLGDAQAQQTELSAEEISAYDAMRNDRYPV